MGGRELGDGETLGDGADPGGDVVNRPAKHPDHSVAGPQLSEGVRFSRSEKGRSHVRGCEQHPQGAQHQEQSLGDSEAPCESAREHDHG